MPVYIESILICKNVEESPAGTTIHEVYGDLQPKTSLPGKYREVRLMIVYRSDEDQIILELKVWDPNWKLLVHDKKEGLPGEGAKKAIKLKWQLTNWEFSVTGPHAFVLYDAEGRELIRTYLTIHPPKQ